jgi:2'-5' RNA ligase
MSLVIVAIPEEEDRVHKISSEKVPHLTLLYLGEAEDADTAQIMQFVQHAVTLSEHGPFYLDVDRRGTLGEAEADVLFFSKRSWNLKWIKQFRGQLLQNEQIRTAFDAAEQHLEAPQEWLPHLTLGYPETPAKKPPPENDYPLYSVAFNRIAVWDGDFSGPEFRLEWPDRELEGDLAVAYHDAMKAELLHYGVKGMRWGQRSSDGTRGGLRGRSDKRKQVLADRKERGVPAKGTARASAGKKVKSGAKKTGRGLVQVAKDVYFESEMGRDSARNRVTHAASKNWAEKDVPRLNAQYSGTKAGTVKGRLKNPLAKETIEYRSKSRAAYRDRLNEEVAKLPGNASGNKRYEISDNGKTNANYLWDIKVVDTKRSSGLDHAAKDEEPVLEDFRVQPTFDDDGLIIGFKQVPMDLQQSAGEVFTEALIHGTPELGEAFILEHYGVKGMRWGFRRSTPTAVAPEASSRVPQGNKRKTKVVTKGGENHPASQDAIKVEQARAKLKKSGPKALTNQELREVADRIRLEQQAVQLDRSKGSTFVRKLLGDQGKQAANEVVRETIREAREKVK